MGTSLNTLLYTVKPCGKCFRKSVLIIDLVFKYFFNVLIYCLKRKEKWEELKTEADMERYDWESSASRKSIEQLFGKPHTEISNSGSYSSAVDKLMNEGKLSTFIETLH